jgi:DNA-binding LacI/PurR family transcriptional regulator
MIRHRCPAVPVGGLNLSANAQKTLDSRGACENHWGVSKLPAAPTLEDVARLAGVSPASVSRVLNGVGPTSLALREAVRKAAEELGYVPRRSRPSGARPIAAVLTPDLLNPYFNEIIRGIEERAWTAGLVTSVMEVLAGRDAGGAAAEWLRSERVRGTVVFGGIFTNDELRAFAASRTDPLVAINQVIDDGEILCINIDYATAMHQATTHLLELGHRRIVFVAGSESSLTSQAKVRGIRQAMAQRGLELADQDILHGPGTVEWGFQAMSSLLARPPARRPTAVMGASDLIALGVLHAVRSGQLSVPRDVSVVGFDDIAMACHANPPLTTVSAPKPNMGRLAVDLILRGADAQPPALSSVIMLESPLIVRESTARVAG